MERGEARDARERREGHALAGVRLEERDRPPDGPDGLGGSADAGLQRRHARNPAASAAPGEARHRTVSRFGRRAAQDGRQ